MSWKDDWAKVVVRAWKDDAFKKALLADPAAVLKRNKIDIFDGHDVVVKEGSAKPKIVLSIPRKPAAKEDRLAGNVVHPNKCCC